MGVIKRGILGGFSGAVANVVGSSWKGIAVIKSKPLSVANPDTAAQKAVRLPFKFCSLFAQSILGTVVKPLWDRFAQGMSGYNAFIKANVAEFNSVGGANWADVKMSIGTLTASENFALTPADGSADVYVSWTDNDGTGTADGTDEVYIVLRDADTNEIAVSSAVVTRADDHVTITMPTALADGNTVQGYISFRSADGKRVSTSDFVSVVVPA